MRRRLVLLRIAGVALFVGVVAALIWGVPVVGNSLGWKVQRLGLSLAVLGPLTVDLLMPGLGACPRALAG